MTPSKKELVTHEQAVEVIPFDDVPAHLRNLEGTGTEAIRGQENLKIPRIKLIQNMSPEIVTFGGEAKVGQYWHTGMFKNLGTEFRAVVCHVDKRVNVWIPREAGGGLAAMSRDGTHWATGANQKVHIKWKGKDITWDTKRNVKESGLLEWGSFDPSDNQSAPAAQLAYDYLLYLVDYPQLSPVFMGLFRTALVSGRQLNTALLSLHKPVYSAVVRVFTQEKKNNYGTWPIPAFQMKGWCPPDVMARCKEIADMASKYGDAEIDQEEATVDADRY